MELSGIIRSCGPAYITYYKDRIPKRHVRTMQHIISCRTAEWGGHITVCDVCGKKVYSYHSCKDRHCPKCGYKDTQRWLENQRQFLLDVPYFHIIFTLPHTLNDSIKSNQKLTYSLLFSSAVQTLFKVLKQNLFGGNVLYGCMAVLHTWTRALVYHTHIHLLVPGGAWNKDTGKWLSSSPYFLAPDKALSKVFRAIFVKKLRKAIPQISLPQGIWEKDWIVKTLPAISHRTNVIQYLGRYVRKTAITNNRILDHTNHTVTFKYQDNKTRQWKLMTLQEHQFLYRYLQHVLPKGFVRIRYYGFMAPANRKVLTVIKNSLNEEDNHEEAQKKDKNEKPGWLCSCPACKKGHLVIISVIHKTQRAPPKWIQGYE